MFQLPGGRLDLVDSSRGSGSVESAQLFLRQSLNRVSTIQNLEEPGAQDLLDFTIRYGPEWIYCGSAVPVLSDSGPDLDPYGLEDCIIVNLC